MISFTCIGSVTKGVKLFFNIWSTFINILGLNGPESVKDFFLFLYLVSLGAVVIYPKVRKFIIKEDQPKKYTKEKVERLLLERLSALTHLREDILFEIYQIKSNILRDQMDYAENSLDASKNEMLKAYSAVIDHKIETKELALDSKLRAMNMQIYSFILDKVYGAILAESRRAFKNNGFEEMSDVEFDLYLRNITGICLSKGESIARHSYNAHTMAISYEEGKSSVEPSKIFEQTQDVFKKAKRIKIKATVKIKELEDKYKEESKKLLSLDEIRP